jgi:hypothetical protein
VVFTSGGTQTINIPLLNGGIAFVGFTDSGASISAVTLNFLSDFVTVDDVRYGATSTPQAVPEPSSVLLLGTGGLALIARLRRRKQQQS